MSPQLGPGHPNTTGGSIGDEYTPQACTSIVAVDENDSLFHGRNMDWDMPNYLRNLTVLVREDERSFFFGTSLFCR